jgi:hypothetical protein
VPEMNVPERGLGASPTHDDKLTRLATVGGAPADSA